MDEKVMRFPEMSAIVDPTSPTWSVGSDPRDDDRSSTLGRWKRYMVDAVDDDEMPTYPILRYIFTATETDHGEGQSYDDAVALTEFIGASTSSSMSSSQGNSSPCFRVDFEFVTRTASSSYCSHKTVPS